MIFTPRFSYSTFFTAGSLFVAGLTLYISTLAPSVATIFDDSLEFQLVTYQLGIAHPTGYPLYTMLGKLFTFVPVGNIAFRVNLMSAVFGAATVSIVYLLILRMIPARKRVLTNSNPAQNTTSNYGDSLTWPLHLGAVIGALLLAVGEIFWQQATIAEVYTLNAFFVAALLLSATGLASTGSITRRYEPTETPVINPLTPNSMRRIYWVAFLAGLSLTHHRTIILLLPALTIYLLLVFGKKLFTVKLLLLSVLFFLLPLLLYLYLPLRGHIGSLDGTYENTWRGFWQQISAGGYGTAFLLDNPFGHERNFEFYWNLLAGQFYTTVPGLIGIVYLFRIGHRKYLALTGAAFLTYLPFNLLYNVTDIEVFFIPVFLIWAIWSGIGAAFLLHTAATLKPKTDGSDAIKKYKRWRVIFTSLALAIFTFMIFQLYQRGSTVLSRRYTWQVHDYGLDMLAQPPTDQEAAIVGILGEMTLLRYFQQTENRRPDIETVTADLESDRLAAVENLLAGGNIVYLTRELPGAAERWSLNAVGPLIRVDPEPTTTLPEPSVILSQPVTSEITLAGYTISRVPHTGQGLAPVRLILFWQTNAPIPADLKVSARLLAPDGNAQAVVDAVPVHFAYPTTAWRPGEIVLDVYDLALPVDTPPGQYTPLIIWYDPAQNAAEVGRIALEPVRVE